MKASSRGSIRPLARQSGGLAAFARRFGSLVHGIGRLVCGVSVVMGWWSEGGSGAENAGAGIAAKEGW